MSKNFTKVIIKFSKGHSKIQKADAEMYLPFLVQKTKKYHKVFNNAIYFYFNVLTFAFLCIIMIISRKINTSKGDYMKELLEIFLEKAKSEEHSFVINIKERDYTNNYYFIQSKVGNCRYVYCENSWNSNHLPSRLDSKLELVAILKDESVYIVDGFIFGIYTSDFVYSENVKKLTNFCKEINKHIQNELVSKFYNELDISDIDEEYEHQTIRKNARHNIIYCKKTEEPSCELDIFSLQDCADYLCGYIDMETEVSNRLNAELEHWKHKKFVHEKTKVLMNGFQVINEWEYELANSLQNCEAKFVDVEFNYKGNTATEKVTSELLFRILNNKDMFSDYDFKSRVAGKELFEKLGADDRLYSKNNLRCEHISRITYRKKDLYIRK